MISSVYSYYLSNYGNKVNAKYDTHKRSDIKLLYNRMLKINSLTPAYKVDFSEDAQKYAIDLKETARKLTNIANELSDNTSEDIVFKKIAESSDPDAIDVQYIGENQNTANNAFDIMVKQTAQTQINTGNYLRSTSKHIPPGEYSFDLDISDVIYEFEFCVKDNESTLDIQEKLKRLVNRSNLGLKADIATDSLGNTALTVESESTGINGTNPTIFTISSNHASQPDLSQDSKDSVDPVNILGLNRTIQYPANAVFSVNEEERISYSNTFTINNEYEITLKKPSDSPVNISLKADSDSISDSINELISGYNSLVSVAADEQNDKFSGNQKLKREFYNIAHAYGEFLGHNGFDISDNGSIQINSEALRTAADDGSINDIFSSLSNFKNVVKEKAEDISINPMKYVNNKIISYKNPFRIVVSPYNTSVYSGMMFNGYI